MESDEKLETVSRTVSNIKTLVGVAVGLLVGAFAAGFALKQQYEDVMKAYGAIHALQRNEWGAEVASAPLLYSNASGQSLCPNGSYMVGVRTPNGGLAFNSLQPICRELSLK
jgi:hypothetical protein